MTARGADIYAWRCKLFSNAACGLFAGQVPNPFRSEAGVSINGKRVSFLFEKLNKELTQSPTNRADSFQASNY
ncbi:hypothetical protein DYBT9623_00618 [Dyadobacter sp. CECT 9623]|uniref:Uncharacterized protein n=1 Tax=Dyadobacter linearis TaxID=2823330 RepID=A0ABN7R153_9BACT|nr:hypothetical protein DYBT9623_00618 [Dyadobacter sp. CECT 9623]